MSERELHLNSLNRFAKVSRDLVLEEHGSCEVPAGCGGVVLRWVRRGQATLDAIVWVEAPGSREREAWIDAAPCLTSHVRLGEGRHALAVKLEGPDLAQGVLAASIGLAGAPVTHTAPDGTWRATGVQPAGEMWLRPGFDDSAWSPLVARAFTTPPREYIRERLVAVGAEALGLDEGPARSAAPPASWLARALGRAAPVTLWVRKEFTVTFPGGGA